VSPFDDAPPSVILLPLVLFQSVSFPTGRIPATPLPRGLTAPGSTHPSTGGDRRERARRRSRLSSCTSRPVLRNRRVTCLAPLFWTRTLFPLPLARDRPCSSNLPRFLSSTTSPLSERQGVATPKWKCFAPDASSSSCSGSPSPRARSPSDLGGYPLPVRPFRGVVCAPRSGFAYSSHYLIAKPAPPRIFPTPSAPSSVVISW